MNGAAIRWVTALGCLLFISACIRPPDFSDVPAIEFMSQNTSTMRQDLDSLVITFSFTDGDGDLGNENTDSLLNIFVTDLRDNFVEQKRIPFVPPQGANNGISGEITITIPSTCCLYPDGSAPCSINPAFPTNELSYDIYIKDRAGHQSNTIRTQAISLICN